MHRRSFVELIGAAGVAAQALTGQEVVPGKRGRCFIQQDFLLKAGTQGTRLAEYLTKTYLPAMAKVNPGPTLVLEAQVAPNLPHISLITGYQSVEQAWSVRAKLAADKEFEAATDAWESGPEAPFENTSSALLEAGDYSPELLPLNPAPKSPRIFEMRIYHAPTWKNLRGLHWRFGEGEVRILKKCGAAPVLFASTAIGADTPNLTWITAFEDEAARDQAWTAFAADPEWVKLRQESTRRYGDNPTHRQIKLYRAAAYSPVR